MKYSIKYLPSFSRELHKIALALEKYPAKAKRLLKEVDEKLRLLEDTPFMCEVYHPRPKYRRMVLEDHFLFYAVCEEEMIVCVHHILYSKMDIEQRLRD